MKKDKPDSFMPLFIADYLADTTHLERDEHGAYFLLLMAYWRNGGPLVADDARLSRIAKATLSEWKRLRPVMLEFFKEEDGLWISKRSDIEIEKAIRRMEAKSNAGRRGAESRWQTHAPAMPVPLAGEVSDPMTKNGSSSSPTQEVRKERKIMSAEADGDGEFSQFWKEYPRTKNMSRKDALKAWKSLKASKSIPDIAEVLRAVRQYKSFISTESKKQGKPYPVKHAQGWLNGQRWEGFLEQDAPTVAPTDWADEVPLWAKFKASIPPAAWMTFFSACRPNGSISTIIAPSSFVRDQIEVRYGRDLDRVFDGQFKVKFERQTADA